MNSLRMMSVLVASACLTGWSTPPSQAASPVDIYKGKQVQIVVGYGPGNAYDEAARLLARHMGNYLPGRPSIIVQNMPGAGTRKAAGWLYNIAPKDGTVMGTFSQNLPMDQVLDKGQTNFDVRKFNWIGNPGRRNNILFVWHATGIKTLADAAKKPVIIGAGAGGRTPAVIFPAVASNFFGAQFRVISGYPSQESFLAMERREIDGIGARDWASVKREKAEWIRSGKINILFQVGLEKDPDLPHVPLFSELAKDSEQREVIEFVSGSAELGRPFVAPPGVSPEIVAMLRASFDETMKDKQLAAEADRANLILNPLSGAKLQALVDRIVGISPQAEAKLRKALELKPGKRKKK